MADEKVRRLIRWGSKDVLAIVDQIHTEIHKRVAEGQTVGLVACVITSEDGESGNTYESVFSRLPVEITMWAAEKIKRRVIDVVEEK